MAEAISYLLHSNNTWEANENISATYCHFTKNTERTEGADNVVSDSSMDLVSSFISNGRFETSSAEESSFLEEENGKPEIDLPNHPNVQDRAMFDISMSANHLDVNVTDANMNESLARLPGNSGQLKCNVCSKDMSSKAHLVRHLKTHMNKNTKEFECSLCGNVYAHKYNLKRHLIKAHNFQPEDISPSLLGEKNAPVENEGFTGVAPLPLDKDDDKSELYATYVGGNGIFDGRANNLVSNFQSNTFTSEFAGGPYSSFSEYSRDNELVLPVANNKPDLHLLSAAPQMPFEFQSYMQQYAATANATANNNSNGNNNNNNNGNSTNGNGNGHTNNNNNNNNNNSNNTTSHKRVSNVVKKEEEKPKCHVCDKELSTKWSLMRHLTKVHKLDSKYGENGPSTVMKETSNADIKFENNELDTDPDSRGEFDTDDHSEQSMDSTFNHGEALLENKFNRSEQALVAPVTPEAGTPNVNFNNGAIAAAMLPQEPVNNVNKIDLNSFGGFPGLTAEEYNYLTTGLGSAQELLLNSGHVPEPMEFDSRNINNEHQALLDSVLSCNFPTEPKTLTEANDPNKKVFECHICGATLSNRSNLKGHLKRHTYGPVQECSVCNLKCADKTSLRQHIKSVHKMWNENGNTSA